MNTKHKGFTLIEILIVLAIAAILTVVMALMNYNSYYSAQANHIIHDFRSLKTAALLWRKDNIKTDRHDRKAILNYLNSKSMVTLSDNEGDKGGYMLHVTDDGKTWYVGYELSNDSRIKSRLTSKAEAIRLLGNDKKSPYNNDSQVWVQVL